MKKHVLKLSALALTLALFSCSKDEAPIIPVAVIPTVTDTQLEADLNTDLGIEETTEGVYSIFQNSLAGRGLETALSLKLGGTCDIQPVTKANDSYNNTTYLSVTYDYSTTGCTNERGATIKGMLKLYYKPDSPIVFKFIDYDYNGKKINGTIELTKTANGDQAIIKNTQNLTVNLPQIGDFTRKGSITRTYIKGYDTKNDYTDDIFEVTGNWATTFPDKTENVVLITKKLVTEMSCPVKKHKSGTISFTRNLNATTVDFGDGTCSPKWTITRNGKTFEIARK